MLTAQMPTLLIANIDFSIVTGSFFLIAVVLIVIAALKGKFRAFSIPVIGPSLALAIATSFSYIDVFTDAVDPATTLLVQACILGITSAILLSAWIGLLTYMKPTESIKTIAFAILLASIIAYVLRHIPSDLTFAGTIALLAAHVVLYRKVRLEVLRSDDLPSFETSPTYERHALRPYFRGLLSIGEGLVSLLVLGCCVGIINGFVITENPMLDQSPDTAAFGTFIASLVFLVIAYKFPRVLNASGAYRILFLFLTGMLILSPFVNFQYSYLTNAVIVAGHSFISTSVLYFIVREAHERSLNSYIFMGMSMFLIRLSSMLGIIGGAFISGFAFDVALNDTFICCLILYLLSLALLLMLRIKKQLAKPVDTSTNFDLSAVYPVEHCADYPSSKNDVFVTRGQEVAESYNLTKRESQILLMLARGRTSTYISDKLFLSPNTVRGHIKNIYTKLGIHSKQEIIDLFTF